MSVEARTQLAAMQAKLVGALVSDKSAPTGFDASRLKAAATSLRIKRARAVARAWPCLRDQVGEQFAAFAAETPMPREGGPLADGRAFALWLALRSELPDAVRLQVLAVDLRYARHWDGLLPRRGPCIRVMRLPTSRRLVVAFRMPVLGEHWFSVPWGGTRTR
jgi:hypothetical protein